MDNVTKTLLLAGSSSASPIDQLTSVTIDGMSGTVYENTQFQMTATGTYSSSSTQDVTYAGNWSIISGGAYANITPSGLITMGNISSAVDITIRFTLVYNQTTLTDDILITANTSNDTNINLVTLLVHV